ncbi:hypothetical protein M231_05309 [Tremella mesenterica]|uniref:Topoisomerase I damage affected protein 2 n=1 Tax=Tremella mesenterica TaxID=5217 RepID=A0A4Q1BID8_TREME|nr:hypothetical protein M231_05309 [Tremella mesenterica]
MSSSSRLNGALSPPLPGSRSGASSPPRTKLTETIHENGPSLLPSLILPHSHSLFHAGPSLTSIIERTSKARADFQIISKSLTGAFWDNTDKPRMASYSKDISERVKQRMMEIEPRGFKYVVTTTLSENLGQAGR